MQCNGRYVVQTAHTHMPLINVLELGITALSSSCQQQLVEQNKEQRLCGVFASVCGANSTRERNENAYRLDGNASTYSMWHGLANVWGLWCSRVYVTKSRLCTRVLCAIWPDRLKSDGPVVCALPPAIVASSQHSTVHAICFHDAPDPSHLFSFPCGAWLWRALSHCNDIILHLHDLPERNYSWWLLPSAAYLHSTCAIWYGWKRRASIVPWDWREPKHDVDTNVEKRYRTSESWLDKWQPNKRNDWNVSDNKSQHCSPEDLFLAI